MDLGAGDVEEGGVHDEVLALGLGELSGGEGVGEGRVGGREELEDAVEAAEQVEVGVLDGDVRDVDFMLEEGLVEVAAEG